MPDNSVVLVEIRAQKLTARLSRWPQGDVRLKFPLVRTVPPSVPMASATSATMSGFSWSQGRGALMPGAPASSECLGGSLQQVDLATGKIETLFERCGDRKLNGPN